MPNPTYRFETPGGLTLEIELTEDFCDGVKWQEWYIVATPSPGFSLDNAHIATSGNQTEIEVATYHVYTKQEEMEEYGGVHHHPPKNKEATWRRPE